MAWRLGLCVLLLGGASVALPGCLLLFRDSGEHSPPASDCVGGWTEFQISTPGPAVDPGERIWVQAIGLTACGVLTDHEMQSASYAWEATAGLLEGTGPEVHWTAPAEPGVVDLTCTVTYLAVTYNAETRLFIRVQAADTSRD